MPTIVETRGLTKVYKMGASEVHALRGVDLTVEPGEFLSVMGRSGSGKSTLLNLIGCLDRPTSGVVILDGLEVTELPSRRLPAIRRQKIGFVFQQFNLLPTLTALENVMLPMEFRGTYPGRREERAMEVLSIVGLASHAHHLPSELSGGEQQRVAIARALANDPPILLADEPTGNLDTETGQKVVQLLGDLNRQGKTIVLVTHEEHLTAAAHRIVHMRDGQIVE